jgi:hypothetical protein
MAGTEPQIFQYPAHDVDKTKFPLPPDFTNDGSEYKAGTSMPFSSAVK